MESISNLTVLFALLLCDSSKARKIMFLYKVTLVVVIALELLLSIETLKMSV